jgi:hypothetical protein
VKVKIQQRVLLIGGIAGLLIGLAAAFLYLKNNEDRIAAAEAGDEKALNKITPVDGISVGMTIVGLVKQIVSLGG